jgi:hypothetical protein
MKNAAIDPAMARLTGQIGLRGGSGAAPRSPIGHPVTNHPITGQKISIPRTVPITASTAHLNAISPTKRAGSQSQ